MTKHRIVLFVLLLVLLTACSGAAQEMAMEAPMPAPAMEMAAEEMAFDTESNAGFSERSDVAQSPASTDIPTERLIIRTGNLSIVVEDTEAAMKDITALVEANGGWVVSSNVIQYSDSIKRGEMTVRIPSTGFDSAMDTIKSMAVEVTRESTSGEDVTEEYVDLSSRLANLEATADRVRSFLDEAKNVEEALAVNQELSRLESDIEVIKGRMQYLSQSAAFSTITIDLTPDELAQPIEVGGWRPQGIAKDAVEMLIETLQFLASFLIWLVIYIAPVGLLVFGPLYLIGRAIVRRIRRRRAAKRATATAVHSTQSTESK
ncbi:MAG: hypothetical protein Kow0080_04200 [Candidatus Promineifilaceae bacterium]